MKAGAKSLFCPERASPCPPSFLFNLIYPSRSPAEWVHFIPPYLDETENLSSAPHFFSSSTAPAFKHTPHLPRRGHGLSGDRSRRVWTESFEHLEKYFSSESYHLVQ